jgi:hypothetical protein
VGWVHFAKRVRCSQNECDVPSQRDKKSARQKECDVPSQRSTNLKHESYILTTTALPANANAHNAIFQAAARTGPAPLALLHPRMASHASRRICFFYRVGGTRRQALAPAHCAKHCGVAEHCRAACGAACRAAFGAAGCSAGCRAASCRGRLRAACGTPGARRGHGGGEAACARSRRRAVERRQVRQRPQRRL